MFLPFASSVIEVKICAVLTKRPTYSDSSMWKWALRQANGVVLLKGANDAETKSYNVLLFYNAVCLVLTVETSKEGTLDFI